MNKLSRAEVLCLNGEFTWDFGSYFLIETIKGNFIWHDPDYGGDNSLTRTEKSYSEWIGDNFGRSKGIHMISLYCGERVMLKE